MVIQIFLSITLVTAFFFVGFSAEAKDSKGSKSSPSGTTESAAKGKYPSERENKNSDRAKKNVNTDQDVKNIDSSPEKAPSPSSNAGKAQDKTSNAVEVDADFSTEEFKKDEAVKPVKKNESIPSPSESSTEQVDAVSIIATLGASQPIGKLANRGSFFSILPTLGVSLNFGFLGFPQLELGVQAGFFKYGLNVDFQGKNDVATFSSIPIALVLQTPIKYNDKVSLVLEAGYNYIPTFITLNNETIVSSFHAVTAGLAVDGKIAGNLSLRVEYRFMLYFDRDSVYLFHQPLVGLKYGF